MRSFLGSVVLGLASLGFAQGLGADFARSEALPQALQGKVFRVSVLPHWQDGGKRFWYSIEVTRGKREVFQVDATSGRRRQLPGPPTEPSGSLIGFLPPHASRSGEETEVYLVNHSKETVSVFWVSTDNERVPYGSLKPGETREQHTFAGHVWLFTTTDGRALAAYEAGDGPGSAIFDGTSPIPRQGPREPRGLSPDLAFRVTIHDHNIFVRPAAGGPEVQLSADGRLGDDYSGQPLWSPDSHRLLAVRTEAGDRHLVNIVQSSPADQIQPKLLTLEYLKPGDKIPHPRLVLFDVRSRREIPVETDVTPNPWDFSAFHWSPDSKEFYFIYNQRGHQMLRLMAADAISGRTRTIVEEKSPTFIDYQAKLWVRYLDSTGEALWMSERSGFNHIYLVNLANGRMKAVTAGAWMVRSVEEVDEKKRQILMRVMGHDSSQDPYYMHFARVNFDGSRFTMLTEGNGTHQITWSPDGTSYLDSYSRVDLPPVTELRRGADGKLLATLENGDDSALLATGWTPPERFVAKGRDGTTDIYGIILRPTNFDPKKKYPVIESIYAGPQDFFVPKSFAAFRSPLKVAELGFIVVQIDGMGTDWRGKAFHDVCYQNLADAGLPDRILWMKAAAATRPWMDISRVGIYGTSAGGQSAASAVMRFGDFYKAAVADCGCHDNRMDKIWWNELWMGWPVGPAYDANSNVTAAKDLKGKLYLMVGEDDTNVDPASTMQVVNALIQANKDFDLLVYPNSNHGVLGHLYAFRRMEDFFVRTLIRERT